VSVLVIDLLSIKLSLCLFLHRKSVSHSSSSRTHSLALSVFQSHSQTLSLSLFLSNSLVLSIFISFFLFHSQTLTRLLNLFACLSVYLFLSFSVCLSLFCVFLASNLSCPHHLSVTFSLGLSHFGLTLLSVFRSKFSPTFSLHLSRSLALSVFLTLDESVQLSYVFSHKISLSCHYSSPSSTPPFSQSIDPTRCQSACQTLIHLISVTLPFIFSHTLFRSVSLSISDHELRPKFMLYYKLGPNEKIRMFELRPNKKIKRYKLRPKLKIRKYKISI